MTVKCNAFKCESNGGNGICYRDNILLEFAGEGEEGTAFCVYLEVN